MHESQSWSHSQGGAEKNVWTSGRNNYAYFFVNFNKRREPRSGPYFVTKVQRHHGMSENQLKLSASLTALESSAAQNSVIEDDAMSQLDREAGHESDDSQGDSISTCLMLDKYGFACSHEISSKSQHSPLGEGSSEDTPLCEEAGARTVAHDSSAHIELQSKTRKITKGEQVLLVNRHTQASLKKYVDACVGDDDCPVVLYEDKAVQVDLLPPEQMIAEGTSTETQSEPEETKQDPRVKSSALDSGSPCGKERIFHKSLTVSPSVPEKSTHSCKRVDRLGTATDSELSQQCVAQDKCCGVARVREQPENHIERELKRNRLHNIVPSNSRNKLEKSVETLSDPAGNEPSDYGKPNVTCSSFLSTGDNSNSKSAGTKEENRAAVSSTVHKKDFSTSDQEKNFEAEYMQDMSDFMKEDWVFQKSTDYERKRRRRKNNRPTSPLEDVQSRETDDCPFVVKKRKRFRNEFCDTDRKAIVRFLLEETNGSSSTGGNEIWKHMAIRKVSPGHSWQSMKEHYRKKIVPALGAHGETRSGFKKYLQSL